MLNILLEREIWKMTLEIHVMSNMYLIYEVLKYFLQPVEVIFYFIGYAYWVIINVPLKYDKQMVTTFSLHHYLCPSCGIFNG